MQLIPQAEFDRMAAKAGEFERAIGRAEADVTNALNQLTQLGMPQGMHPQQFVEQCRAEEAAAVTAATTLLTEYNQKHANI